MGTPAFARDVLDAVLAAPGHQVVAVYTQPARPGGRRGRELVKSPVQLRAEEAGLPVYDPVSLKGAEAQAAFERLAAADPKHPEAWRPVSMGTQDILELPTLCSVVMLFARLPSRCNQLIGSVLFPARKVAWELFLNQRTTIIRRQ